MNVSALIVAIYGIFTMAGGMIGYFKAQSTASLIAGLTCGLVLLVCGYALQRRVRVAAYVAIAVSLLLTLRFGNLWLERQHLMPDLVMVLFSVAALIATLRWLFRK